MMTRNTMKIGAFILLIGAVTFLMTCNNMMDSPKSGKETGTVTFSVAEEAPRTVVPTVEIASYELWGGKTTGGNQTLIDDFEGSEVSVSLEVGTYNFTLNALNSEGDAILQATAENVIVTTEDTENIVFSLEPFTGAEEYGSVKLTVNYYPQIPGIGEVEVIFNNDEPSSTESLTGVDPYIFERNNVPPGDYPLILKFKNNTDPDSVKTVMTIMEIIKVKARLKSEKVIDLAKPDSGQDFFTDVVQGATLAEKMQKLNVTFSNYRSILIEVPENDSISAATSIAGGVSGMYFDKGISVTLRGTGPSETTVSLTDNNSYPKFAIGKNVTFILENITLEGLAASNSILISIEDGGTLILNNGAKIINNKRVSSNGLPGGGVYVAYGGSLIMNGGEISGNTAINGGGVYVDVGGSFEMNGGTITGNTATNFGGGVYVAYDTPAGPGGSFAMNGGRITGDNIAPNGNGRSAYYNKDFGFFRDNEINGALSSESADNWVTPVQPLTSGVWYTATQEKFMFSFTGTGAPQYLFYSLPDGSTSIVSRINDSSDILFKTEELTGPPYRHEFTANSGETYYVETEDGPSNFSIILTNDSTTPQAP